MRRPQKHLRTCKQPRYPWDDWLRSARKRPLILVRGVHFVCQVHSMNVQIRAAAIKFGLRASVHINEERLTVEVY